MHCHEDYPFTNDFPVTVVRPGTTPQLVQERFGRSLETQIAVRDLRTFKLMGLLPI